MTGVKRVRRLAWSGKECKWTKLGPGTKRVKKKTLHPLLRIRIRM